MDIEYRKLTKEQLEKYLDNEPEEFGIEGFRKKYGIDPNCDLLYVTFNRWVEEGRLKRQRRGYYRKVEQIKPIHWWDGEEKERLPIVWPGGIEDGSSFGFDDTIEVFPGDSIVVAGESNKGKTTFALNFMVNNLHLFEGTRMLVNEYKPQRFRARMKRFTWADYWNNDKPKFELLPVMKNHIDYIMPDYQNIIDWLHIKENFWEVAALIEEMQMVLRNGILFAVLQKTRGKPSGVGGDWGTFFPAVYLTIHAGGRLFVEKVKSAPKGKITPEGKNYAFDIVDGGSKLHDIREVRVCPSCKGRRYIYDKECERCYAKGYVEIE